MTEGTTRRQFLRLGGAATLSLALPACGPPRSSSWGSVRLVHGASAGLVELTCLRDAAALLQRAVGQPVPVLVETGVWGEADVLVATSLSAPDLPPEWRCGSAAPGAFRIQVPAARRAPRLVIAGADAEGARNGLYRFLESAGFGFFRDGEVVPGLATGSWTMATRDEEFVPAFARRGDMIWDYYLGPFRYCAAAWDEAEWERALLFAARRGLDFIECYPPLETVFHRAFPAASGLDEGVVWEAEAKHELMRRVVDRGRALGLRFLFVLTYGWFPEPVRALFPHLEWRGEYLCAHQPELREMTRAAWAALLEEFGSDHLFGIRHRGEEGQSYSDPCRSVTKAEGLRQAVEIVEGLDPEATITVWTWSEQIPELFDALPASVEAAHIRHGMGGMFDERGEGREQQDGRPPLPAGRRWWSGQFTVFSGSETLLRTSWCDPVTLAGDARASAADPDCVAYFQWPEWAATSPWLSHLVTELAWRPEAFDPAAALEQYAVRRHGRLAGAFLAGFGPLVRAGNARFTSPPRGRLVVPFFLSAGELDILEEVRTGLAAMVRGLTGGEAGALYGRDLVDLGTWAGVRQAEVFEAHAWVAYLRGDGAAMERSVETALAAWSAVQRMLEEVPELSLTDTARTIARTAPLSARAVDSFWVRACDFYKGYPLTVSPEAIELVFAEQARRLGTVLQDALERGGGPALESPGFFWHDFPDARWADAVRALPREDAGVFERLIRGRVSEAFRRGTDERIQEQRMGPRGTSRAPRPRFPSLGDVRVLSQAVGGLLGRTLPPALEAPPAAGGG